ncbi:hypothetical protein MJN76_35145, partial [Salmonella enterica subsp. enterica serovar Anatum]|nr:hypothetical protein [Salmonella enterica subsp. enterica serovar Anatum]
LQAFSLNSTQETNRLLLRLPVLQGLLDGKTDVSIPALKLGAMITGTGGEVRHKTLMIAGVMSLKHGDAEGFFRAKVVIKRPF